MRLKSIFLTLCVLLIFNTIYSQSRQGGNFSNGSIRGKVIDAETKKGLVKATATLVSLVDSSIVTGGFTDNDGILNLQNIKGGKYIIRINYVGYEQLFIDEFTINRLNPAFNFGTIELNLAKYETDALEITAERDVIQFDAGKRVINVDQDIASKGGNALDVLKNAPSVNVDIDGNVSLRGSGNITVLINGKPSTFMGSGSEALEQIPSEMIDHIEIVTNPSAKYEAQGASGILNVILKQERDSGINGLFNLNVGTRDRYSTSLNLNYKTNGINLFGGYTFHRFMGGMDGDIYRETFSSKLIDTTFLTQTTARRRSMFMHNIKGGIEFNIDKNQSVLFSASYRPRNGGFSGTTSSNQNYSFSSSKDFTFRESIEDGSRPNYDLTLNYRYNFDKEHYLTFDVFSSYSTDNEYTDYVQRSSYLQNDLIENSVSDDIYKSLVSQLDYVYKFSDMYKLESGLRFGSKLNDSKYRYYQIFNQQSIMDSLKINDFIYDESILASYLILSADYSPLLVQLGLRGENANIIGDNTYLGKVHQQNYFDLFPSANLTYKYNPALQIQANYSRRISRPGGWSLNPFVDHSDIYTLRYGNPDLLPEYSNLFEFGTIHNFSGFSVNPNIFFRTTDNVIERYTELLSDSVAGSTWKNMSKSEAYGIELNLNGQLFKFMRFNGDISYYNYKIIGIDDQSPSNQNNTWSSRLSLNMLMTKKLNFQVSGYYTAPTVTSQGQRSSSYSIDVGARYDLFENFTMTLRASDIFDTQNFSSFATGPGFNMNFDMRRQTQFITLGIQYKINQGIKQKERTPQDDSNQGGREDF